MTDLSKCYPIYARDFDGTKQEKLNPYTVGGEDIWDDTSPAQLSHDRTPSVILVRDKPQPRYEAMRTTVRYRSHGEMVWYADCHSLAAARELADFKNAQEQNE